MQKMVGIADVHDNFHIFTLNSRDKLDEFIADFNDEDLSLPAQDFEDYKSKYLDVHDKVQAQTGTEKASVLEDIDFELSLIYRDEINVAYILNLLVTLSKLNPEEAKKRQKEIINTFVEGMGGSV